MRISDLPKILALRFRAVLIGQEGGLAASPREWYTLAMEESDALFSL
jgi:hypothetical protein